MKYTKASAEVVLFDNSDVVTTSGCLDVTSSGAELDNCTGPASTTGVTCGEAWQSM